MRLCLGRLGVVIVKRKRLFGGGAIARLDHDRPPSREPFRVRAPEDPNPMRYSSPMPSATGSRFEGFGTWVASTVIVWGAALLAAFILPSSALRSTPADTEPRAPTRARRLQALGEERDRGCG